MTTYRARRRPSALLVGGAIVLALVVGGVVGAVIARSGPSKTPTPTPPASATPSSITSPQALAVESVSPAANASGVAGTAPITISLSGPISASSPTPTLSPDVPGSWHASGSTFAFTPSGAYMPLSVVSVTIPGGSSGVRERDGGSLPGTVVEKFRVENGSVLRLQQLLSLLSYSPINWTPTGSALAASDISGQAAALFNPPPGTFAWNNDGWPSRLRSMWHPAVYNVFTKGLVMSFQADHGLDSNGHIGPALWQTLLNALSANTVNTGGYDFALADKSSPETFTVWHDGQVVLRSSMNSGIAAAPTPDGTFPVYTRLRRQVMRGTNPSGTRYADLVQYIAYFHGSDAVHYMDRADYGIPQSLGCIELPLASASHAWPYLAYGTLVSIVH